MRKASARRLMAVMVGVPITTLAMVWPPALRVGAASTVTMGEAYFMIGNLVEAAEHLQSAVASATGAERARGFYLLGRISLLTGDFRQAKEYFERALDEAGINGQIRLMARVGIGDAHLASGLYEEAIRRYRRAANAATGKAQAAGVELKISLAEHYLGREEEALRRLKAALREIPVLRHWLGREEQFYQTMAMIGIEPPPEKWVRFFVLAGPLEAGRADLLVPEGRVGAREVEREGALYWEFGPFPDPVEAMIFSEELKQEYGTRTEVISK